MPAEPVTAVSLLLAAVAALAGVVSVLFFQNKSHHEQCLARERDCEEKQTKLLERVVAVETKHAVYADIERRLSESFNNAARAAGALK